MIDLFNETALPEQRKPRPPVQPLAMSEFRDYGDGIDRIPDWRIGELLVFNRQRSIHTVVNRNRADLEDFATLLQIEAKSTGGRPGKDNYLTFEQAMYSVAASQALNAVPILKHMITIYGMWSRDELIPRDAEAEVKVADATAKAFDAAPELMQLVKPAVVEAAIEALRSMNIVKSDDLWRLEDNIRYEVEKQLKPIKETVGRAESAVTGLQCDLWEMDKRSPEAIQKMRDERDSRTSREIVALKSENGKLKEEISGLNRQVGALLEHARANPLPGIGTPIGTSGLHILATPVSQKENPEN